MTGLFGPPAETTDTLKLIHHMRDSIWYEFTAYFVSCNLMFHDEMSSILKDTTFFSVLSCMSFFLGDQPGQMNVSTINKPKKFLEIFKNSPQGYC